jgi:acyl carrier protein
MSTQREYIYEKLTELFRDLFSDENIVLRPETKAHDIDGWDSFNHLSIIVAVETRFKIKIRTAEIENLADVAALVNAIESKIPSV